MSARTRTLVGYTSSSQETGSSYSKLQKYNFATCMHCCVIINCGIEILVPRRWVFQELLEQANVAALTTELRNLLIRRKQPIYV